MYDIIFSAFFLSMASTSPANPSALIFRVDEKNPFFTFKEEILSKLTDEKCSRMPIIDGFLKIRRCEVTKSVAGVPLAPPGLNRDCLATNITFSSLTTLFVILCISSNSFLSVISVIIEEVDPSSSLLISDAIVRGNPSLFIYFSRFLFEVIRQKSKNMLEICSLAPHFSFIILLARKCCEQMEKIRSFLSPLEINTGWGRMFIACYPSF